MEAYSVDGDGPPGRRREGAGVCRRLDGRRGGEDLHQPLGGPGRPLQLAPYLRQGTDAAGHNGGVEDEGRQLPGAQAPGQHVVPAHPQDEGDGAEDQQQHRGHQLGPAGDALAGGGEAVLHPTSEILPVGVLMAIGLDDADLVDGLVDAVAQLGHPVLAFPGQAAHLAPEHHDGRDHQGHTGEGQQGELDAGGEQHHQPAHEQQGVAQGDGQAGAHHVFDLGGVGGEAGDHFTGAAGLEPGRGQGQQMVEDPPPDVRRDPLSQPGHVVEAQIGGHGEQHDDAEHGRQAAIQPGRVACREALVDHRTQALAHRQHGAGGQHQGNGGDDHPLAVGGKEVEEGAGGMRGHGRAVTGRRMDFMCNAQMAGKLWSFKTSTRSLTCCLLRH